MLFDATSQDCPHELFGYAAIPAPGAKCPLNRQTVELVLDDADPVLLCIGCNNFKVSVL